MNPRASIAFALLLTAPFVLAQDEKKPREMTELEAEAAAEGGVTDGELAEKAGPTGPAAGLESFMSPVVSFRPRRLGPGESGTMHVMMAMQKTTVLTPEAHFELQLPERVGPLTFGTWQLDPPKPGTLDTAFRGKPVYDNIAHAVVPVTVDAGAAFGDVFVSFTVVADVVDGQSGQIRGRLQTRARGTATIGDPLPRPAAIDAGRGAPGASGLADDPTEPEPDDDAMAAVGARGAGTGGSGVPIRGSDAGVTAADRDGAGASPAEQGLRVPPSTDWFWIGVIGAGAALVVVVILLARRG